MKNIIYTLTAISALALFGCTNAGKNQTVEANTKVYFDVSGVKVDLGGKITKYTWEHVGAEAENYSITIFDNGTDHASFISPNVSKKTILKFELTSTESYKCKNKNDDKTCKHHKGTDTTNITVTKESTSSRDTNTSN